MSVNATLIFPISAGAQTEAGQVRLEQTAPQPIPGSDPPGENANSQNRSSYSKPAQDEVKVQMAPPGEIAVYKFLDQNGNVVLQVPPQPVLELAQAIHQELDQELAQEAAPKEISGAEGGNGNGR